VLAVAYRNLVERPTRSVDNLNSSVGEAFARADRSARRQFQRFATESLLRDLWELKSGVPSSQWPLKKNREGKPTVAIADGQSVIEVSVSHSGALALAGITDLGEIGVDVKYRTSGRSVIEIAAYAFGPQEQSRSNPLDRQPSIEFGLYGKRWPRPAESDFRCWQTAATIFPKRSVLAAGER
jgi:phosphopantetheinyl transferase